MGLVVPHAGYVYSGAVAAHAYKLLDAGAFDRVLIVAPSHRAAFSGVCATRKEGYRTPLGVVPIDRELVEELQSKSAWVQDHPEAEALEHSLEIQLPFLQVTLGDFRLTPLLMGDQSFSMCESLSTIIHELCRNRKVLLVASTDLSHFHSYQEAKALDRQVLKKMEAFDPRGLSEELASRHCEACGGGPMITVMLTARKLGADTARVLHYANSGDVTGDRSGVVGYMAGVIFRSSAAEKSTADTESPASSAQDEAGTLEMLDERERAILRELALESIRSHCLGTPAPSPSLLTPRLREHRGAFVCIHKGKELRGCIGVIEGTRPLHETVQKMAVQAGFNDPRFRPLTPSELEDIHVEISVLTPMQRIKDVGQIQLGKHGLWICRGHRSGLLLPQVATQQGWNVTEFLEWTCRKAGLPPEAWKDAETEIYIFSAQVF